MFSAPRDLIAALCALFGETFVYFLFSYMLMPYLVVQVRLSNVAAGFVYAAFGGVLLVMTMVFGALIDRLLLRRTLQLQLGIGTLTMALMAVSRNVWWTGALLFGPLSFALAVGLPALPVAVRRYTTADAQTIGFGVLYVVMNMGTALAQLVTDAFRIHVLPYSGTSDLVWTNAYALLFVGMALVHFANFVVVTVFVRDVYVADESWTLAPMRQLPPPSSGKGATVRAILGNRKFWYFVLLSLATTGAKSIYRYLDSLYPLYMMRAPYPGGNGDPESMPFMTLLLLNPLLACVLTPLFSYVATRRRVHPYDAILAGCCISAGAPFFMMIMRYWAVIAFVLVLTVGESMWAPMLQRYTNDFCDPGTEGLFYALATIPLFAAKIISGSLSGLLLSWFCPALGACDRGSYVWLIIGCISVSSPVLLLATVRCTRL